MGNFPPSWFNLPHLQAYDAAAVPENTMKSKSHFLNSRVVFSHENLIYSQTRLIRTLLIRHFRLIRRGNLNMLKALSITPMLNYPLNLSPRLVHRKISAYFSDELSGSNCNWQLLKAMVKNKKTPICARSLNPDTVRPTYYLFLHLSTATLYLCKGTGWGWCRVLPLWWLVKTTKSLSAFLSWFIFLLFWWMVSQVPCPCCCPVLFVSCLCSDFYRVKGMLWLS